jgi:hypothetical protein
MVVRGHEGEVGLADAITAMVVLQAGPAAAQRIAALLGFHLSDESVLSTTPASAPNVEQPRPPAPPPSMAPPAQPPADREPGSGTAEPSTATSSRWERRLRQVGREFSTSIASEADPLGESDTDVEIDLNPLLKQQYTARVIQAACATDVGDGDLDLEEVVETLATRRPLTEWPRRASRSMLRGVQLLIDVGESMMLFARDTLDLAEKFKVTVGDHLVEQMNFAGCPWHLAGHGSRFTWRPYQPPPPSTPVVVLSDLNIPSREDPGVDVDGWIRMHDLLARRGSPMIVFVPFPQDRWPITLRRKLSLVQWDRGTSASAVLKRMNRGGR